MPFTFQLSYTPQMGMRKNRLYLALASCVIVCLFYLRLEAFFPNNQGFIGHDYSYFMPELLDGVYWHHVNGLSEVAWFTPSFGGGLPKFPNPQSLYYSVPQFLSFITNPLLGIKLTTLLFGILGFGGFFLLLSCIYNTSSHTALYGASLFLFNGFFLSRMIVGHLTYHSFMLLPFLALCVLRRRQNTQTDIANVVWGSCIIAYMIYSGNIHLIPVTLVCITLLILLDMLINNDRTIIAYFSIKFLSIITLAVLLSAARIYASYSYLSLFPRDFYALPGYKSLAGTIAICFRALFLKAPEVFAGKLISTPNNFGLHEYEYGVTLVPLVLLILALITLRKKVAGLIWTNKMIFSLMVLLLCTPIVLNYHLPIWNLILKHIPFLKSSSTLIRWISLYIPIVIVLSSLSIQHLRWNQRIKSGIAVLGILGTFLISDYNLDKDRYHQESYDARPILLNYDKLKSGHFAPQITDIGKEILKNGQTLKQNNLLIAGISQLRPYEPIFGYRLETFPNKSLRPGPVLMQDSVGHLNLKNPAAFVFPVENNTEPGAHFHVDQTSSALKLANYKPFPFHVPIQQKIANFITLTMLLLLAIYGVLSLITFFHNRSRL
ncbi:MAG: hypothetical protein R8G66_07665 [Cytophagales bacterium]|nr:hypothetical protein [Cytophagales bacterium]